MYHRGTPGGRAGHAARAGGNTRYPELRLITCGGPFDTATRQYLDNIVVYTHLVS